MPVDTRRRAYESISRYTANIDETRLRIAQRPVMHDIADFFYRYDKGYVTLPTGVGKTVIFSEVVRETGLRTLIVVPTRNLLEQTRAEIMRAGIEDVSIVSPTAPEARRGQVSIVTYAGFVGYAKSPAGEHYLNPEKYELVIFDEAHHVMADGASSVAERYRSAFHIGFTATPDYSELRQLTRLLPRKIHEMSIVESIDAGLLSPFANIVLATNADMSHVKRTQAGDYESKSLEAAINTGDRNLHIAQFLAKTSGDRKTVVSCNGIDHAINMAAALREAGISAAAVYGRMPKQELQAALDGFRSGTITAITNNKLLTEGFDDPTIEVVVNASPTLSQVRQQQRSGRALRLDPSKPEKQAIVIDCLDSNYRVLPVLFFDDRVAGTTGLAAITPGNAELFVDMNNHVPAGMELFIDEESIRARFERVQITKRSNPSHGERGQQSHSRKQSTNKERKKAKSETEKEAKIREVVLGLLGIDPVADNDWPTEGTCNQVDTELFYPEKGGSTREAKKVCERCAVSALCLGRAAIEGERFGIWGGKSERERRSLIQSPDRLRQTLAQLGERDKHFQPSVYDIAGESVS